MAREGAELSSGEALSRASRRQADLDEDRVLTFLMEKVAIRRSL
jgi:hypothetical protein